MWNSSQSGGFMNSTTASPGGSGGSAGGKAKARQNVVPVMANHILSAAEEEFTVEGMSVGMVVLCGQVANIEKAATKTVYSIEDDSGQIEVVQWVDEESRVEEHGEGSRVKVVGSIRSQGEKKHVMAFKISSVASQAEADSHILSVELARLKIKQLQDKINGQVSGAGFGGGLSNSMMGGGLGMGGGMGGMAGAAGQGQSFGNKNYDTVYGLIRECVDEQGINKDLILNSLRGKLNKNEIDGAIDFLSNEGHIYSTIDDDHFKTTNED